eukprot:979889-Prorocentrum_minimum.AAC.1
MRFKGVTSYAITRAHFVLALRRSYAGLTQVLRRSYAVAPPVANIVFVSIKPHNSTLRFDRAPPG